MLNKTNSNGHLDEMQVQTRNKVGAQSFFMLYYLLLIDLLLKNYGVTWAATPISIFAVMTFCMAYFLIRIVWAGAYTGPRTANSKGLYFMIGLVVIGTFLLAIIQKTSFFTESVNFADGGFSRLLIFFFVFFTVIIVFNAISRRISNKGDE